MNSAQLRRPVLPRGVRLHWDTVRNAPVLLGPERALMLDDTAHAVLSRIDGQRTEADIAAMLAEAYAAPESQVSADIAHLLQDLFEKRLLDFAD